MTDRIPTSTDNSRSLAASTVWTAFLGAALLGLVVLPRHSKGRAGTQEANRFSPEQGTYAHEGAAAERVAEMEADRGRKAEAPFEIPAKGWWDIGKRVVQEFGWDCPELVDTESALA